MRKSLYHTGFSQALLERLYAIPDPVDTDVQFSQWTHRDLEAMERAGLLAERQRVRLRLLLDPSPDLWLLDRAARLEEALRRAH